jgi:hypothetical protein
MKAAKEKRADISKGHREVLLELFQEGKSWA